MVGDTGASMVVNILTMGRRYLALRQEWFSMYMSRMIGKIYNFYKPMTEKEVTAVC